MLLLDNDAFSIIGLHFCSPFVTLVYVFVNFVRIWKVLICFTLHLPTSEKVQVSIEQILMVFWNVYYLSLFLLNNVQAATVKEIRSILSVPTFLLTINKCKVPIIWSGFAGNRHIFKSRFFQ